MLFLTTLYMLIPGFNWCHSTDLLFIFSISGESKLQDCRDGLFYFLLYSQCQNQYLANSGSKNIYVYNSEKKIILILNRKGSIISSNKHAKNDIVSKLGKFVSSNLRLYKWVHIRYCSGLWILFSIKVEP